MYSEWEYFAERQILISSLRYTALNFSDFLESRCTSLSSQLSAFSYLVCLFVVSHWKLHFTQYAVSKCSFFRIPFGNFRSACVWKRPHFMLSSCFSFTQLKHFFNSNVWTFCRGETFQSAWRKSSSLSSSALINIQPSRCFAFIWIASQSTHPNLANLSITKWTAFQLKARKQCARYA